MAAEVITYMGQIKQPLITLCVLYYIRDRKQETDRKVAFVYVSTRFTLSASFELYNVHFSRMAAVADYSQFQFFFFSMARQL